YPAVAAKNDRFHRNPPIPAGFLLEECVSSLHMQSVEPLLSLPPTRAARQHGLPQPCAEQNGMSLFWARPQTRTRRIKYWSLCGVSRKSKLGGFGEYLYVATPSRAVDVMPAWSHCIVM